MCGDGQLGPNGEHANTDKDRQRPRLDLSQFVDPEDACAERMMWQEIRTAARRLLHERALTVVAVLALGLGIGVNTTFFTLVNAICLKGLPIEDPDRVMFLGTRDGRDRPAGLSFGEVMDLRAEAKTLSGIAAYAVAPMTMAESGLAPDRVLGTYISSTGFDVLGVLPHVGRGFAADEDRPGAQAVVVLGDGIWKTRYASDPAIVGRTVILDGVPSTVVGVMPEGFRFPATVDVWRPLAAMPGLSAAGRGRRTLSVFARLADTATSAGSRLELATLGARWANDFPESNTGIRPTVVAINEQFNGRITDRVWLAFLTGGSLVMLIACANVGNLLLMGATARTREVAVRLSIGATRLRVVRQLLTEAVLLASLAAAFGLVLSIVGLRLLSTLIPPDTLPYWIQFTIDVRVMAVVIGAAVLCVVVCGLAPAVHLRRLDVNAVSSRAGRSVSLSSPVRRSITGLLVVEFGLTLVLLAAVVVGIRVSRAAQRAEFPVDGSSVLTMSVSLPSLPYSTVESRLAFYEKLHGRFRSVNGVAAAAIATALPRGGGAAQPVVVRGRDEGAAPTPATVPVVVAVGQEYFRTLNVPLRRGREFTDRDGLPGQESAIVNERFVTMFLGDEEPLGALIRVGSIPTTVTPWMRIVGIVPTVRQRPAGIDPDPVVYLPLRTEAPQTVAVLVRANRPATALAGTLRGELAWLDSNLPAFRVMTLERAMRDSQWNARVANALLDVIAGIALVLALIGLYAVTADGVGRLRQELAIRMAVGAGPWEICRMVLRRIIAQLALGLIAGVGFSYLYETFLLEATPGISMRDPVVVALLATATLVVAMTACLVPLRRAVTLDPVAALRTE
jgi:putative ABC transport system permease protein